MSRRRVANVMTRTQSERVCVTYTRRGDGSMVTRRDLFRERVVSRFRRIFSWLLTASAPLVVGACQTHSQLTGRSAPQCKNPPPQKPKPATEERVIVTGGVFVPRG
ncbi:MAG TPA: hypothetical protein VJU77_15005 [Chthoniobacterales bacterium]|nr:hypothetical protein [Chthoniobacterales bacterium]